MKVLAILNLLVSVASCAQIYPGTPSRPILSASEAASFTKSTYLQGWTPPLISTIRVDYTVGSGGFGTIQAAVNAAINAKGTTRKYIKITQGIYNEVVYIPATTTVPITLYGAGKDPSSTVIRLTLSAISSGSKYAQLVGRFFRAGDPGYKMYSGCARKATIGTSCSSVVWARAANVQIINLTIQNLSKQPGTDQAVALFSQGDKYQVSNCRLLGHQDTFWSGATGTTVSRGHVTNTYIEGDTDFVFGGGATVFEGCTFYVKSDRRRDSASIFGPATASSHKYGYLVVRGVITGDRIWSTSKSVRLARSWDVSGVPSNGQLVVRESTIDGIIPSGAPYNTATSGRLYAGNANMGRNLNDNRFNKFWEFANRGAGA